MTPLTLTAWADDVLREFAAMRLRQERSGFPVAAHRYIPRLAEQLAKLPELVEQNNELKAKVEVVSSLVKTATDETDKFAHENALLVERVKRLETENVAMRKFIEGHVAYYPNPAKREAQKLLDELDALKAGEEKP